jgi:hypothetical protein
VRKTRKQLVGKVEDVERYVREKGYRALRQELRGEWFQACQDGMTVAPEDYGNAAARLMGRDFRLVPVSSKGLPVAFPQAEKSLAFNIGATE